eukprot:jgi/Galph1/5860/GphlegSOOS_G4453.1
MSQQLCPPEMFGIVESGIYRSNLFFPISFLFIKLLNLKTVLLLSAEVPTKVVSNFLEENAINLVHLGSRGLVTEISWKPMSEELVKDGLEWVLDRNTHPILICDTSGNSPSGDSLHEYRAFAASKTRYVNEQFIELFDVDLVTLPNDLPAWFRDHLEIEAKETEEYQRLIERNELDELGIRKKASRLPRYQRYFYSHEAKLHFPQGQKDIRIERFLPQFYEKGNRQDADDQQFYKWRKRERLQHDEIPKIKSPADVEIQSVRRVLVPPPTCLSSVATSQISNNNNNNTVPSQPHQKTSSAKDETNDFLNG